MLQTLTVLGSTGSIGQNVLDVVARHLDRYKIFALTAHTKSSLLFDQCIQHRPEYAVLGDPSLASGLQSRLKSAGSRTVVLSGVGSLDEVAVALSVSTVVAAIVGGAGLSSSIAAARAGKRILLANKESLVMAGPVFLQAVRDGNALLLPVDSEHNAIFQSLPADFMRGESSNRVQGLWLTASGGPFLHRPLESLEGVTPAEAVRHPNWRMGAKISVDSATMMNKCLEVIEAHWLFGVKPSCISVVIHPQSIVHSLVQYIDGSVLAQLGHPDMRSPIAQALAYPERIYAGVSPLDISLLGRLDFEPPDKKHFPGLYLAWQVLEQGGSAPAILNASNEVAVAAFLERRLKFTQIVPLITDILAKIPSSHIVSLDDVVLADEEARAMAKEQLVVYAR